MSVLEPHKCLTCFGEVLFDCTPWGDFPGGAPMNVGVHAKSLSTEVNLISRIGKDNFGNRLLSFIEERIGNIKYIQIDDKYPSGKVQATIDDSKNASYKFDDVSAWDHIELDPQNKTVVENSTVFLFGSLASRNKKTKETLLKLIGNANFSVFDVNFRPPYIDPGFVKTALQLAHAAKFNEEEITLISSWHGGSDSMEENLYEVMKTYDLELACLTLGDKGAWVLERGQDIIKHPGYKANVKDTIGAGDAFLGAFITKFIQEDTLEDCLDFACAVGAYVSTCEGATPILDFSKIDQLRTAKA